MRWHTSLSLISIAAAFVVSAGVAACSDDDSTNGTGGTNDPGGGAASSSGGNGGGDGTPAEPPVYAVISTPPTSGGAAQSSYVILSGSLTGELKPENAVLELPGRALGAAPNGSKRLFVGTEASGELTRYDLVGDDALQESGKVSFAPQQITGFVGYASAFQFIQPNKAYWISRDGKIVVWNPEELTVTGSIPIPQIVRQDPDNPSTNYTTAITGAPLLVGDELYAFASWDTRQGSTIKVPGAYAVIVVDTTTDTADVILDEAGCGYGRDAVLVGDWLYIATEGVGTAVHYLNPANGPAPCLRRFNVKTKTFDASYKIDLNALAGGPAGSLAVTANGHALIHVLDTAAADPLIANGTITNPRFLTVAPLWKTAKLTVGDTPSIQLLDTPLRSGAVLPVTLSNDLRVTATFDDNPQIVEVTENGFLATERTGARVVGNTAAIVQLR